jgi:hypothetical protein
VLLERDFNDLANEYRIFAEHNGPSELPSNLVISLPAPR